MRNQGRAARPSLHPSSFLFRLPLPDLLLRAAAYGGQFLLHLAEGDLDEGDDGLVGLLAALELEHVVVGAARAVGVFAADAGARVVDGTAALLLVEEQARLREDDVLDLLQDAFVLPLRGGAPARRLERNAEVFGEARDVAFGHLYALVDRAAVGRALVAVEVGARLVVPDRFNHLLSQN